ncbi:Endonuclease-reverse transcriptase [Operophtera brumata]|uniref:Endonuclease-reverse transcriptase n=1 Tax=Operophtera brumata TaxID=104452 RepID=A0A0L7KTE5_OPEBR|nr:Endonuclease-reverse transcriptase [Operophtera brumata]
MEGEETRSQEKRVHFKTQQRNDLKIQGLQNARVAGEYVGLCRSIDRHCRADKNNFIQGICKEIEVHSMKFQTADLFKKVRLLSRQFKHKTWTIEDGNGQQIIAKFCKQKNPLKFGDIKATNT